MALNKLKYNSLNLTPAANKAIGFDSDADALEATLEGGAMTFIKKLSASSSSDLSFVNGASDVVLDSTYKEYMFIFNNIHPSASAKLGVNFSDDTSSHSYDLTKTNTLFNVQHDEADSYGEIAYAANDDLAQSTSDMPLSPGSTHTNNDDNLNGFLHLFNPSSTTFVKHFIATVSHSASAAQNQCFVAGYCNTTAAVTAVRFKFASGNIDAGTITLYGIN